MTAVYFFKMILKKEIGGGDVYYSPFNQFQNYSIRQESITRVTGEEGAKAYQMAPNSSAALFDGNEDIFYLKTTDGAGFPTIRKFKFEEITDGRGKPGAVPYRVGISGQRYNRRIGR